MKDEHDKQTLDYFGMPVAEAANAPRARAAPPSARKPKRLPNQSSITLPEGAKPELSGLPLGFGRSVVPVSAVAREWGISARRVRVMLAEGRLSGRLLPNGYWEVFFPYCYTFGTRGPGLKRHQKQERRAA